MSAHARDAATFTQLKRRDQLMACTIDAIGELGFARASVAEVARRAGVSKGVITYHFAAKDGLISGVIESVLASMREYLEPRWRAALPLEFHERCIGVYVTTRAGYYRAHAREVLALMRIYNSFRDGSRAYPAFGLRADDIAIVTKVLQHGQETGRLGPFDPHVMAALMKAAVDDLLTQLAVDPGLDLESCAAALVTLLDPGHPAGPGRRQPRRRRADHHLTGRIQVKPYSDTSHIAGLVLPFVTLA